MDQVSAQRLTTVVPKLADLISQMDAQYQQAHAGDYLTVQQALRSYAEQAKIYAQGRTTVGPIVTNAPPGHSWHEFGMAADVCPKSLLPVKNWDPENAIWPELATLGRGLGLYPGADYKHVPPDRPHFQLTGTLPVSPDDATRATYLAGGLLAVWELANLYGVSNQQETQ